MNSALRLYVTTGVALVGASIVVATPVAPPPSDVLVRAVQLTSGETIAFEMGGSGFQILPPDGIANAFKVYVQPNFHGAIPQPLGYPAQLYPFQGPQSGFFDPSLQEGQEIMNSALMTQLANKNDVVFYGTSQSATIQTLEMDYLASLPLDEQPSPGRLGFVSYGDPDVPNGGLLSRFDYPDLPSNLAPDGLPGNVTFPTLGVTFIGPTPADTPYHNVIYTGEYDGYADFPKYPANFLADLNAFLGILYVHDSGSFKPASLIDTAIPWQASPGYDGDTTYYLVPTPDLPLLDPLRGNPVGDAIADLLQPDLKVLVNLGYGPDNVGYSEYPNVFTPASGLFPDVNPATVLNELVAGAQQGVQNFLTDLKGITPSSILAAITNAGPTVTPVDLDPSNFITQLQTVITENSNALATLIAGPLDTNTPAVDALTALAITLPTVNVNLVLAGLGQLTNGNIDEALADFTDPIANNVGLIAGGAGAILLELDTVVNRIQDALQSAATADMDFIAGLPGLLS